MVIPGIEVFLKNTPSWARGKRIGLLCNQASVDRGLRHSSFLIDEAFKGQLKAIFSPQHGLFSQKQDNMKESSHFFHEELGVPVFSLYSETRAPKDDALGLIDLLLIDLQDCGTRVYTYIWTMLLCLKACAKNDVSVAILDRPNPLGGVEVEGNILEKGLFSFVGMAEIPMRHGMTMGELSLFFRDAFSLDLELFVIRMEGWKRDMYFDDTGLIWVLPSPNMPSFETAIVYPGQVLLEGTNISEGRGTTRPFLQFGAPFLRQKEIKKELGDFQGIVLRDHIFEPTFNKWQGKECYGFEIHVTDKRKFRPYRFTLAFLSAVNRIQKEDFSWLPPPYEYDFHNLPEDLIIGNKDVRKALERGTEIDGLEPILQGDERLFIEKRAPFLLY